MRTAACPRFAVGCNAIFALACLSFTSLHAQTSTDVARLVHPDVADQVGLDDAQRAKIQTLLQQRLELQSQATPEKRADVSAIDKQIQETLTPEQWKAFQDAPPEQKLRFQFREQSWGDVLQWFARQDNLTLVMDRVPAGTFTYSDNRSYTPTEGIDLLNSVLLTKNFTLLRRDRMLTVLELTGEIPIELIPRVKLEELPARGRFELVSVLFPLGKRPVEAVVNEVQPYLSNYGRAVPLAQSRQLLVIETAGKMQTINLLIASVPEPAPPPQPPKPEPPPVAVFAAYPLGNLDPQATLATIKKLIPSEQITVDDKTRVLSAFLIPAQQTAIQTAITQMQKDTTESPGLESMSYRVTDIEEEALQKQILAIAPSSLVSFDKVNSKVIVTAPAQDQAKVAKLLEVLGSPTTSQNMAVKSFSFAPAQADAVTEALKAMLPNAQVLSNEASGIVIVRGSSADLQLADEVVTTYKTKPSDSISQLKVFPLEQSVPASWLAQVTKAFPEANLWLDAEQKQLLSLATIEEHDRLEAMLPELKKLLPRMEKRTIAIYPLTPLQLQRWPLVESAAKTIIPNATLSPPTEKNELIVWGSPADHEQLKSLLEELQQQSTADNKVRWPKVYPLKVQQPALVVELLQNRFSDAKISYADGELTVWADQAGQQAIDEILKQLSTEMQSAAPTVLQVYAVDQVPVATLQTMLADVLGKSKAIPDSAGNRLLVWATQDVHTQLSEAVAQIAQMPASNQEKVLVAYPLQHVDGTNLKTLLATAIPEAVIVVDSDGKQLIATASLMDQLRIKATIEQLDIPRAALDAEEIRTYAMMNNLQAATLSTTLQTMFPKLKLTVDSTNNQILATGPLKDHQQLQSVLDRLFAGDQGESIEIKTYEVPYGDLTTLPSILMQIAPKAVISTDISNRTLLVWATASQHEKIAKALEQLNQKSEGRQILQVYKVPLKRSAMVRLALVATFPTASIGVDGNSGQILVLATKEMQTRIEEAIKQLLDAPEASMLRTAKRYDLPKKFRSSLPTLLNSISTSIAIATPATDLVSPLVILATTEEHQQIEILVKSLIESQDLDVGAVNFKVYDLGSIEPAAFANLLAETRPQARLLSPATATRVVIADTDEGHIQIDKLRESLQSSFQETTGLQFKTYSLRGELIAQLTTITTSLAPTARLFPNPAAGKMVAVANAGDHEKIQMWITELDTTMPPPPPLDLRIYPLGSVDKTQASEVLAGAFGGEIKIVPTTKATELTIQATGPVHERVSGTLKILMDAAAKPEGRRMELFAIDITQADVTSISTSVKSSLGTSITVTPLVASNSLLVVGTDEQIEQVRKILESLQKELPPGQKRQSVVYALKHADPIAAVRVLSSLLPKATLASDTIGKKIAATASEAEHKQIADFVASYDQPVSITRETRIYQLNRGTGRGFGFVLSEMLPEAIIYGSRETSVIMATASPEDHQKIQAMIDEYNNASGGEEKTVVIALKKATADSVADAIQQIDDEIRISADDEGNTIVVTTSTAKLQMVESIVKQMEESVSANVTTKSYPLKEADPTALQRALRSSFPRATLSADDTNGTLYVTATEAEHTQIAELIASTNQSLKRKPTLKTFMLKHSSAGEVANSLEEAFGRRSNVGVSFDENTSAVFVVGNPEELSVAEQVITQMDVIKSPGVGRQLKAFSLSGADGDAIVESIEALFPESYPEVNVSWDLLKEQLVVIGSAEQLALVEETLKQFAPPERELEIFYLRNSDPSTVQTAISSLFADEPYATSPTVNKDEANSQVLVRGTKEQLTLIRQLLQKMGEPLTERAESASRGRVRTVVLQRDSELLLEQLRKVWPQVRNNPLEIIRVPNESAPPAQSAKPSDDPQPPPRGPNPDPFQDPPPAQAREPAVHPTLPQQAAGTAEATGTDAPPVVVIPGDRQWTIASEDTAALDQFEALLAAGMRQPVLPAASTGNYSVYMLRHADAEELQQVFTSLFRRGATGSSSGFNSSSLLRTTFVADTRINALVMYGGNADRMVIEELLSVLDSDELINQLQLEQPTLISVENTDAQRVVDVLQDVYENQLTSDGGRKPLTIPEGISADVATILQQINAETAGPLLTLGVETTSNAIVVRAPAELSREISDFIQLIDQRAGEQRSRQIQVIRLRESKSSQIEEALQMLLKTPRQGR